MSSDLMGLNYKSTMERNFVKSTKVQKLKKKDKHVKGDITGIFAEIKRIKGESYE